MKYASVPISRLGTECWLPKRFTGGCEDCPKFEPKKGHRKCMLPEPESIRVAKNTIFGTREEV